MFGNRISYFSLTIFLFIIFTAPSSVFARGGGSLGGFLEGFAETIRIEYSNGVFSVQIIDPFMFYLYIAIGIIFGIILFYIGLRSYRVNRRLNALENEMHQRAYESWNLKNMEIRYRNDSNNGYLVCEECNGYFMLEKDENPQEFGSCQCGGNLIYYNDLDEFLENDNFKNENTEIIN